MADTTACYISAGVNCSPGVLHCSADGLLCFGTCHALAVATRDASDQYTVTSTWTRHADEVSACRWVRGRRPDGARIRLCVTGSADRSAVLWYLNNDGRSLDNVKRLSHHKATVTHVDGVWWEGGDVLIATGSADQSVCLWSAAPDSDSVVLLHCVDLGVRVPVSLHLCGLPVCASRRVALICVAVDDNSVEMWHLSGNTESPQLTRAITLSGHKDWVRCIDSVLVPGESSAGVLYLATGSQDESVRIWRLDSSDETSQTSSGLSVKTRTLLVDDCRIDVRLESVLLAHRGWVYGVCWGRSYPGNQLSLATVAMDNCLLVWCEEQSVWVETARLGSSGANSHGFFGCDWHVDGQRLFAHDFRGALHIWRWSSTDSLWLSEPGPGGHFGAVCDLNWSRDGRHLLTCSSDKTTRLHAEHDVWREYFRPQVHGHELCCVSFVDDVHFVSGGEEKLARVFTLPVAVRRRLATNNATTSMTAEVEKEARQLLEKPAVSLSSLGLTNKAVNDDDVSDCNGTDGSSILSSFGSVFAPPVAETLAEQLLWPELMKLYGHGSELSCLAVDPSGRFLATACRATTAQHAAPLLWSTSDWRQTGCLTGASQLTVIQMEFSPDSDWLLVVSRDRSWSVFGRHGNDAAGDCQFSLNRHWPGAHSRLLWCCSWLADSGGFVTGSRDGSVRTWRHQQQTGWLQTGSGHKFDGSVTAVCVSCTGVMAVGLESGCIVLLKRVQADDLDEWGNWSVLTELSRSMAHHLTVRRLQFRPLQTQKPGDSTEECQLQLASASTDRSVKIYNITLHPS